ncbi:2-(trimethylamino)ethylphosphonate dioxygenase-like [Lytechinus pictus]|uniref:2-(trimethylamino)ethylphosphonate dioxygenase-like n=1 Tax=Lytechinus pictus TaxID=7653 RepID=UPI0030B9E8D5
MMSWVQKCVARSSLLTKRICKLQKRQVQRCICSGGIWNKLSIHTVKQWMPSSTTIRWSHTLGPSSAGKLMNPSLVIDQLSSDNDNKILIFTWSDGVVSRYNTSWLRINCHCSACKQPDSGQRLINITDFPAHLTIQTSSYQHDGESGFIRVKFIEEDDHECIIPVTWLKQHSYSPIDLEVKARLRDVKYLDSTIKSFGWADVTSSESDLFEWLDHLNTYGVTILNNVPLNHESVTKVANLIGPVTETLYGPSFDVRSEDKPINVAYSSVSLGFHIDLAYYESPPGLQLLHCLQFDNVVTGGESIFIDAFYIAEEFRRKFPHHFDSLTRIPATFQKFHFERANPAAYIYQRPHINVNHRTGQVCFTSFSY